MEEAWRALATWRRHGGHLLVEGAWRALASGGGMEGTC